MDQTIVFNYKSSSNAIVLIEMSETNTKYLTKNLEIGWHLERFRIQYKILSWQIKGRQFQFYKYNEILIY